MKSCELGDYVADVVSYADYYPFGMQIPDRTWSSSNYRYGFNGKEKDEDGEFGSTTSYDYGFRIYNPAIGKFLSVDPLSPDYPYYTPYQFAGNTPVWAFDIDGLEEAFATDHYDESRNFYKRTYRLNPNATAEDVGKIQFKTSDGEEYIFEANEYERGVLRELRYDAKEIAKGKGGTDGISKYSPENPTTEILKRAKAVEDASKPQQDVKVAEEVKAETVDEKSNEVVDDANDENTDNTNDLVVKEPTIVKETLSHLCALCIQGRSSTHGGATAMKESLSTLVSDELLGKGGVVTITIGGATNEPVYGWTKSDHWEFNVSNNPFRGKTVRESVQQVFDDVKNQILEKGGGKITQDQVKFEFGEISDFDVSAEHVYLLITLFLNKKILVKIVLDEK